MEGFSVLHPSPFAFLAAGNSKALPSAPHRAGMLQMWSRTCKSHPCLGAVAGTRWTTWLRDSRYSPACLGKRTQPPPLFPAVLSLPVIRLSLRLFRFSPGRSIPPSLSLCIRSARGSVQLQPGLTSTFPEPSQHKGMGGTPGGWNGVLCGHLRAEAASCSV